MIIKCVFGQSEVEFLDYLVTEKETRPLAVQIQANMQDWKQRKV